MGFVHRRGDGHHDKVGAGDTARVGGAFELAGGTQVVTGDFAGGVVELAVGGDLGFGEVVADGLEFLAEFDCKRQTDVAEADDGDGGVWVDGHGLDGSAGEGGHSMDCRRKSTIKAYWEVRTRSRISAMSMFM